MVDARVKVNEVICTSLSRFHLRFGSFFWIIIGALVNRVLSVEHDVTHLLTSLTCSYDSCSIFRMTSIYCKVRNINVELIIATLMSGSDSLIL